jgi:hypothetical protein
MEWCKARARAQRWSEEVDILQEEQRRALMSLDYEAEVWQRRATLRLRIVNEVQVVTPPLDEGLRAYAAGQALMFTRLRNAFSELWFQDPVTWKPAAPQDDDADAANLQDEPENHYDNAGAAAAEDFYHVDDWYEVY